MTGLSPALIPIPVQSQEQWPSALQASYEVRENPHPTWERYLGRNHGGEKKMFQVYRFKLLGPVLRIYENSTCLIRTAWVGFFFGLQIEQKSDMAQHSSPFVLTTTSPNWTARYNQHPNVARRYTHTQKKQKEPTSFVAGTIFPTQLELNRREPPLVKKHAKREVLQTSHEKHETKKDGLNACKRPCRWWHQTITGWWWKWPKLHSSNLHILIFLR